VSRTEYDGAGNAIAQVDALGRVTRFAFDALSRQTSTTDALGGVSRTEYDLAGNALRQIDTLGRVTQMQYDALNRGVRTTDALGGVSTTTFDAAGQMTHMTDALGRVTQMGYDAAGRQTTLTNALGQVSTTEYDAVGNVTSRTDALNRSTTYTYDFLNRLKTQTDASGAVTQFAYNSTGQQTKVIDALGRTTQMAYDALGRMVTTTDAANGTTTTTYNAVGNAIRVTDALSRVTQTGYDALNRATTSTDALGRTTQFAYDAVGNRVRLTDPSGQATTWDFDALHRVTKDTDALGAAATFAYDSEGNRIEAIDRSGRRRTFLYDGLNRPTQELWWTGTAVTRATTQTFDAVGNRLTVVDPDSRLTFAYDALNRVLSVDTAGTPGGPSVVLNYQYDTVGNRTCVQDNAGARVDSFFDNRNLLTTRSWSGAGVADSRVTFGYDAAMQRTQIERWLGVIGGTRVGQTTSGYDVRGWLTTHTHKDGIGANLVNYTYAYDHVGQVTQATHHNQSVNYTYDLTGQMTRADFSAQADEDYTFDNAGNRTGQQRVTSTGHRLSADANFDYQYDADGNLTRKTQRSNGEYTAYIYDYRQRLVGAVRKSSGGIVLGETTFTYDALDRLIKRVTNGAATWTVYDGEAVWADYDSTGQVKSRYLTGDRTDELLARWTPSAGVGWYLTDRQGTVRDLANGVGTIINHVDYSAFGVVLAQSNASVSDRFLYTGREYDASLALYWYRARWYDANTGRFTSADPLLFGAGDAFNPYRYVGNAPANGTDPSGMQPAVGQSIFTRFITLPLTLGRSFASKFITGPFIARASSWAINPVAAQALSVFSVIAVSLPTILRVYTPTIPKILDYLNVWISKVSSSFSNTNLQGLSQHQVQAQAVTQLQAVKITTAVDLEDFLPRICGNFNLPVHVWQWSTQKDKKGNRDSRVAFRPNIEAGEFDDKRDRVENGFAQVMNNNRADGGGEVSPGAGSWAKRLGTSVNSNPSLWKKAGGHVVSKSFGGPGRLGNIVPQTVASQNIQEKYETEAAKFADPNSAGWTCLFNYQLYYIWGKKQNQNQSDLDRARVPFASIFGIWVTDGVNSIPVYSKFDLIVNI
jgi:RHS repeat-associated protein